MESKLFTQVLLRRLTAVLEPQLLDYQYGFRAKRGIQDPTTGIKAMAEEFRRRDMKLYAALLDLSKAYDSVPRAKLFKILRHFYKVDPQLVGAIEALYEDTEGVVRCGGVTSAPFPLRTGLRQGCLLSPLLFTAYMDYRRRQMDEEGREHCVKWQYARDLLWRTARGDFAFAGHLGPTPDVTLNRCVIWGLLYADDIVLLVNSAEKLQRLVSALKRQPAAGGKWEQIAE